ncbi:MAG TPA: ribosome maturation factor RimM [Limnochordia bacterium]
MSIGLVRGPHGVEGEVRVLPLSDHPDRLASLPAVDLYWENEARGVHLAIERWRHHGGQWVVKFAGIDDRSQAAALHGALLQVPEAEVPPLPPDVYYHFQLVGLSVHTCDGRRLGRIVDILSTGAHDVFVVRPETAGRDVLIPALKSVVRRVDVAAGRMEVDPPAGLIEEAAEAD